ncbi:hypothetical protein KEM09_13800 [Carboxylicivirga mesophila]|uniref:Trypsin-co-occurring domain-containing protein n=1 Tax=Carboxylicivirga mesophila TaxID=1166478 RepID=A0ABS5KBW6_9BACT|nr:trypco2 family protein [Carboxylicivirga mesophila]MBS2212485.1 hypothetical protein [Carboxylicivirga mesophila]
MSELNLKELIHQVREELIASEELREQKGLDTLFEVDKLKIEVNFVVEKVSGKSGGVNLKVIDGKLNKTYTEQQVHKITLDLKVPEEAKFVNSASIRDSIKIAGLTSYESEV